MTQNAIAAYRAVEEHRHNLVYEEQQNAAIQENMRHNKAYEAITRQGNILSYQASIYGSKMHYAATKYASDKSYAATVYSANKNYAANIYAAQLNARNVRYNTDATNRANLAIARGNQQVSTANALISSRTQRYGSNLNAQVQRENISNQNRMNIRNNLTNIGTTALSGMSNASSSFARLIPLFVGL